jgi:hypothetical protein
LRKPHVGLAWLHRFWLRLVLAGLACCVTSRLGPGQSRIIVNRTPAVLEPPLPIIINRTPALPESPQEVEDALPAVLEFEPSGAPLPPIPSVLVFEPAEAPAPMISGAPGLAANRPPLPALSSERALRPGKAPLPAIPYLLGFRASTPPLPSQSSSPDFEPSAPPFPPLSNVPVFTSPLAILSDHRLAAPSQRAAFGSVMGLDGSKGVDNRTTFFYPMKTRFAEPFVHCDCPAHVKDTHALTGSFSDPIPASISLAQPMFRGE